MELQWPLILFTVLGAFSAGLFASQCVLAVRDGGNAKAQMPALVGSVALLAASGIAVFFHLQHWERIFNGFGHITSGITQELIAILVLLVAMVAVFSMLRGKQGHVPAWLAVVGAVAAAVFVVVMSHSYMMASRPAWNSVLWVLCVLGNAIGAGALAFAAIDDARGSQSPDASTLAFWAAVANAIATLAYTAYLATVGSGRSVDYYFDSTHPNQVLFDPSLAGPLAGANAVPLVAGVLLVGLAGSIACAIAGRRTGAWRLWGFMGCICVLVGAVCIRVVFYQMGASVFLMF